MKLGTILNPDFKNAVALLAKEPLPLKTSFKLKSIIKKVNEKIKDYEDVRRSALDQFGEKDAQGNLVLNENGSVKFTDENLMLFSEELSRLLNEDVDVEQLTLEELGDKLSITTENLLALGDLIKE